MKNILIFAAIAGIAGAIAIYFVTEGKKTYNGVASDKDAGEVPFDLTE